MTHFQQAVTKSQVRRQESAPVTSRTALPNDLPVPMWDPLYRWIHWWRWTEVTLKRPKWGDPSLSKWRIQANSGMKHQMEAVWCGKRSYYIGWYPSIRCSTRGHFEAVGSAPILQGPVVIFSPWYSSSWSFWGLKDISTPSPEFLLAANHTRCEAVLSYLWDLPATGEAPSESTTSPTTNDGKLFAHVAIDLVHC